MSDKQQYIQELKDKALYVKSLLESNHKRRPVVIEFSGTPKSGKTTSINSLMQFLKRNDFKVKVLHESASVCPVKDKHGPMFNIWTACDTVKSLIGEIESDRTRYDVILVDRGIFDAMCWFEWLYEQKKMDREMQQILDQFFTLKELVAYVDVVFVYKVRPEVSIQREYASLLTDIPGSIMNEEVLEQYLKALDCAESRVKKEKYFRQVCDIDASDRDQNDVGKEVTENTLEILRELFEEQIGYLELHEETVMKLADEHIMSFGDFMELCKPRINLLFGNRSEVEYNKNYIQPIPIAVLKDERTGKVLMVKKPNTAVRSDSTEKDKTLAYVGGHIRVEDIIRDKRDNFLEICKTTLQREVREEIGIAISLDDIEPILIYVRDGSRSDMHMAVCFLITEHESTLKVSIESEELTKNRGKSKSGTFVEPASIVNVSNAWSKIILEKFFQAFPEQLSFL